MGHDSTSLKPVFFAYNRRRWRIFAAFFAALAVFAVGLALLAGVSLLRDSGGPSPLPAAATKQNTWIDIAALTTTSAQATAAESLTTVAEPDAFAPSKTLALLIEGGPNPESTPHILDILAQEKVRATFVPAGTQAAKEADLVRRIFAEGHEIGNPAAGASQAPIAGLSQEIEGRSALRVIEAVTGHSTLLRVAPELDPQLGQEQVLKPQPALSAIGTGGTLIVGADATGKGSPALPVASPMALPVASQRGYVLVLRDQAGSGGLDQDLVRMIRQLRQAGYAFTTVSGLLGKSRDEVMPNLDQSPGPDRFLARANRLALSLTHGGGKALEWIFTIGAALAMVRTVAVVGAALCQDRRRRRRPQAGTLTGSAAQLSGDPATAPLVSVLIPAYNEMLNIVAVLEKALRTDYPNFEIIMIDDGSTDQTYARAAAAYGDHPQVRLVRKANGGKASALNAGLRVASGEFTVCIDGDTVMMPDTIHRLLAEFRSDNVAAVAGCIKIAQPHNLLTRWQEVEYIVGQNLDRHALEFIGGINTVPGALGAFRRQYVKDVGGYSSDTLAEDTDLTLRLAAAGYHIAYAPEAYAWTEAPETTRMLLRQRFRWSFGSMQTLWKHRGLFGSSISPGLGWFTMPQVLIFQLLLPFLVPVADVMLIAGLWAGSAWRVLAYGLVFLTVDLIAAGLSLILGGERRRLPYLFAVLLTQRVGYRYFVFIPLLKALLAAIHGRAVGWGHLQRLGRVAQGLG